jgi:hypothetical protein
MASTIRTAAAVTMKAAASARAILSRRRPRWKTLADLPARPARPRAPAGGSFPLTRCAVHNHSLSQPVPALVPWIPLAASPAGRIFVRQDNRETENTCSPPGDSLNPVWLVFECHPAACCGLSCFVATTWVKFDLFESGVATLGRASGAGMNALVARAPNTISWESHSCVRERIQCAANAFRSGNARREFQIAESL